MKKALLFFVAALLITLGSALHAQAILGTWQGTLPIAVNPRIIVKIAKSDDGSLRATVCAAAAG